MSRQDDLKKLIAAHQRRLQKRQEQQARLGINTPPEILTEIEDIQADLARLQAERQAADLTAEELTLRQTLQHLPETAAFRREIAARLVAIEQQLAARVTVDRPGPANPSLPCADSLALRRAYLHRLKQQTRRLPLAGIDPKAAGDADSQELQLAAVYTALLTRRPVVERQVELNPRDSFPQRIQEVFNQAFREILPLSALEVLNHEPRLVLLGDPGSGKSTFVNFVGLCLAGELLADPESNLSLLTAPLPDLEANLALTGSPPTENGAPAPQLQLWEHGPLLPVRLTLRDLAARGLPAPGQPVNGDMLWAFMVAELGETLREFAPHLKKILQEEDGLILLDGLDEVPDANQRRLQVKQAVQGFVADFPRCRFLVTSRTYAYQRQDWKLEDFAEAVLSPFTSAQVVYFIQRWYTHIGRLRGLNPYDAQGRAVLLKTAIERSPRLADLAARPLLLTLMASLHAWRGGSLPEKREELYADAVDLLLDQWEGQKARCRPDGGYELAQPSLAEWLQVDRQVVRAELNRLAFTAHRDQPRLIGTADVSQERLVSALLRVADNPAVNPSQLVIYIRDRAGLLTARGDEVYTFPHRSFQEYLAACHLTDDDYPDRVAVLARTDPQRWREVALLAGAKAARGSASAAWNLADALCFRDPPPGAQADLSEADRWGALLAAQLLLENERERLGQVSERNAPKRERIRRWLRVIVEQGWLPPVDRAQAGEALALLGDDRCFDELMTIPAGPFLMGSSEAETHASSEDKPQHLMTLPEYRIGKYPITNAQYRRFVEITGQTWDHLDKWWRPEKVNCPAVYLTWYEACAYCAWLTATWRAEGKIVADEEVRLPTEAEWEKAARGDRRPPLVYTWGYEWDKFRCNNAELGLGDTCAVGMFPAGASPYGCLDMIGNVWEWTSSLWGRWADRQAILEFEYPYDPADGRENLAAGKDFFRVLRGGSFIVNQDDAHCACRYGFNPSGRYKTSGFRVVVAHVSG